ncbi:MAG: ABC transporter permease [Pseudomonadota bacterium]
MPVDARAEAEAKGWRAWLTAEAPQSRLQARAGQAWIGWLAFSANPLAMIGAAIIVALVLMAALAPVLATHDPLAQDLQARLTPPGEGGYLLGSDELGRDIWSRIVHGASITLFIVALVAATAPLIGLLVGTVAGYLGGWADVVLMRVTDVFLAFPRLVLALAFVAALGAGIENAILAITLTAWPPYARIARAETITIRNADYIAAIRLQGAGPLRIITGHIWPQCMSSIIIRVTLDMAGVILTAAGLGFLGLGAQPPTPEWGAMISAGRKFILDHWWVATMPGLAIFIVSLGFNLLGDGLRDVLDPKAQGR